VDALACQCVQIRAIGGVAAASRIRSSSVSGGKYRMNPCLRLVLVGVTRENPEDLVDEVVIPIERESLVDKFGAIRCG
jgi:hypothetical protein